MLSSQHKTFSGLSLFLCSLLIVHSVEHGAEQKQGSSRNEIEVGKTGSLQKVQRHREQEARSALEDSSADSGSKNAAHSGSRTMRREEDHTDTKGHLASDYDLLEEELTGDHDLRSYAGSGWWNRRRSRPCTWRSWGGWGACSSSSSATCGPGSRKSTRGTNPRKGNGAYCYGSYSRSESCFIGACPVDCRWGPWSGWESCPMTCGPGPATKKRRRSLVSQAAHGGKPCEDTLHLDTAGPKCAIIGCPINCVFGTWGNWTSCTASCSGGAKERLRDKVQSREYGGLECVGKPTETETCNRNPCPVDCALDEWSEWGDCSKNCGGGKREMTQSILINSSYGGEPCPSASVLRKGMVCNEDDCPVEEEDEDKGKVGIGDLVNKFIR